MRTQLAAATGGGGSVVAAVLPRKAGGRRRSTAVHAPALPRLIVRVRPVPTLLVLLMVFIKLINISFKEFDDMGKELMKKIDIVSHAKHHVYKN